MPVDRGGVWPTDPRRGSRRRRRPPAPRRLRVTAARPWRVASPASASAAHRRRHPAPPPRDLLGWSARHAAATVAAAAPTAARTAGARVPWPVCSSGGYVQYATRPRPQPKDTGRAVFGSRYRGWFAVTRSASHTANERRLKIERIKARLLMWPLFVVVLLASSVVFFFCSCIIHTVSLPKCCSCPINGARSHKDCTKVHVSAVK